MDSQVEDTTNGEWELVSVIPKPTIPKIMLAGLILLILSACLQPKISMGAVVTVLLFAAGVGHTFHLHKKYCADLLVVQTDGMRLRLKRGGGFVAVKEIERLGLVRDGRSWHLIARLVLANGSEVVGNMHAPLRFQIPITGLREYLDFLKPIVAGYGITIE